MCKKIFVLFYASQEPGTGIRSQELRRNFLLYVKNRDLSFQFSPVKLSSGVVYGQVVSKSIATAEMVYFHDRHASARRVIENKSKNSKLCVLTQFPWASSLQY